MALEEAVGVDDQVVEVEQVAAAERAAVRLEELLDLRLEPERLQSRPPEQDEEVLGLLLAHPELAEHGVLVLLVRDAESGADARLLGLRPEDPETARVQGPPLHHAALGAELAAEPLGDLIGGLVGEREGEDPVGRDAVPGDVVADAADQAEGLPGTGPRDDKHGPGRGLNGNALFWSGAWSVLVAGSWQLAAHRRGGRTYAETRLSCPPGPIAATPNT